MAGPPPPGPGPLRPPYPPPGPYGQPGPPFQPYQRRRSKAPLIIPLVAVLLAAGGAAGAYFLHFRPNQFLKGWAEEIGHPSQMTLDYGDLISSDGYYFSLWEMQCSSISPCNPSPVEDVTDWLHQAGDTGATEREVAQCFAYGQGGCQRRLWKDGHKGIAELSRDDKITFKVQIKLYW